MEDTMVVVFSCSPGMAWDLFRNLCPTYTCRYTYVFKNVSLMNPPLLFSNLRFKLSSEIVTHIEEK